MNRNLSCVAAVLSLVLIAGCGDGADAQTAPAATPNASGGRDQASTGNDRAASDQPLNEDVKMENAIADCMKNQGFQYLPHPDVAGGPPVSPYVGAAALAQPDDAVRKWRSKYGFGRAARILYPNDPQLAVRSVSPDPNGPIVDALDPAQRKAYNLALTGYADGQDPDPKSPGYIKSAAAEKKGRQSCFGRAEAVRAKADRAKRAETAAADHRLWERYRSDTALQAAGQKYADCLKGRGYTLGDVDPESFADAVEPPRTGALQGKGQSRTEALTPSQAKVALAREVKAGLDDVDCRGPYAKIMRTEYADIATGRVTEGGAG